MHLRLVPPPAPADDASPRHARSADGHRAIDRHEVDPVDLTDGDHHPDHASVGDPPDHTSVGDHPDHTSAGDHPDHPSVGDHLDHADTHAARHGRAHTGPALAALVELDELLAAGPPLTDATCARLPALAAAVPGRQRAVAAALGATATSAAVDALLALSTIPGALEALTRCIARGVVRRFTPLALVDPPAPPPIDIPGLRLPPRRAPDPAHPRDAPPHPIDAPHLLALDFRSSRTRTFPELVRRAHAIADQARGLAEFTALAVQPGGKHHYRLSFWTDRNPAALAASLRAAHLDLTWLHARLVRLRGTRLWLSGWSLADDHPIGPAAQAHLLQAWLRWAEQEPAP